MPGINRRKCCCCDVCGFPTGTVPRVTITGYSIGCCSTPGDPTKSAKPDAVLYPTLDLSRRTGPGFQPCQWSSTGFVWSWSFYLGTICGGGATSRPFDAASINLLIASPTLTGTGASEWQLTMTNANLGSLVFAGNLPYTSGDCVTTLTFSNNGYHSGGLLKTGCCPGGAGTVEFH